MMWSDLDIDSLVTSTEGFVQKLRKMKALKSIPVFASVEKAITSFQTSLPLIQDLKNEAFRDRHWKQLMEMTGITFEINQKALTLGKIFDMDLGRFDDKIPEITNAAVKELTIENEMKKMAEVWKEQKFDLFKYMKGRQLETKRWLSHL